MVTWLPHHVSLVARSDDAVVDDLTQVFLDAALENHVAVHEILVGDIEHAGDDTGNVHLRALAKVNTVRIDQVDLAVGRQRAEDGGRISADHAVKRDRRRLRLYVRDVLVRADGIALPVDDAPVGGLTNDRGIRIRCADAGLTPDHLPILRPGKASGRQQAGGNRRYQQPRPDRAAVRGARLKSIPHHRRRNLLVASEKLALISFHYS
jgi:hypothetical protein